MSAPYHKTGSDELPAICLVDGQQAHNQYGVPIYHGGPCPGCNAPVDVILHFNPTDSYYYFVCPVCLGVYRYLDPDGNLDDLKEVVSRKNTPLDEEEDVPWHWV